MQRLGASYAILLSRESFDSSYKYYSPLYSNYVAYLSSNHTKKAIGVDPSRFPGQFEECNISVHLRFFEGYDFMHPTIHHVTGLLERGIRVLNYAGDVDWIAHWHGNLQWTETLEWSGADKYQKTELRSWLVDDKVAGKYKRAGNLAFATISNAGHMVRCFRL
jgi:carboxypeptidase C (cathepsin A)